MKTTGIIYIHGDRKHSSDRFLSKAELKKIFNPHSDSLKAMVEMRITYTRRKFRIGKRSEGKYVQRKSSPVTRTKSRMLYI